MRSHYDVIETSISLLLDDPDFGKIGKRTSRFNIFEAIGAVNGELRHSNFLAFILSPARPHDWGSRALQLVLRSMLNGIPLDERPISVLEVLVRDLDDAVVHRERDSIDLLIEIDDLNLVVVIENKIHAKAGKGQLLGYRGLISARYPARRKLFIFLTPDGHAPGEADWHAYAYSDLATALEPLANDAEPTDASRLMVAHYIEMLRKNIVEDAELRSLAAKLYERHAEAFEFILASRPKNASLVETVAQQVRATEGLLIDSESAMSMRFAPEQWDEKDIFRTDPKLWTRTGRGLLFDVKCFAYKPGRLNGSLVIGPGNTDYRKRLYEAAKLRPDLFIGLVKPMGAQWVSIFSRDLLSAERAATMSAEQQASNLRLAWSDFQGLVLPQLIEAIIEMDASIRSAPSDSI